MYTAKRRQLIYLDRALYMYYDILAVINGYKEKPTTDASAVFLGMYGMHVLLSNMGVFAGGMCQQIASESPDCIRRERPL